MEDVLKAARVDLPLVTMQQGAKAFARVVEMNVIILRHVILRLVLENRRASIRKNLIL